MWFVPILRHALRKRLVQLFWCSRVSRLVQQSRCPRGHTTRSPSMVRSFNSTRSWLTVLSLNMTRSKLFGTLMKHDSINCYGALVVQRLTQRPSGTLCGLRAGGFGSFAMDGTLRWNDSFKHLGALSDLDSFTVHGTLPRLRLVHCTRYAHLCRLVSLPWHPHMSRLVQQIRCASLMMTHSPTSVRSCYPDRSEHTALSHLSGSLSLHGTLFIHRLLLGGFPLPASDDTLAGPSVGCSTHVDGLVHH